MKIMKKNGKTIIITDNEERFWDVVDAISDVDSYILVKNGDAEYTRNSRSHIYEYKNTKVVGVVPQGSTPSAAYMVRYYNEADAEFGYDPGVQTLHFNLERSVAKSIARHYDKNTPDFVRYWAESEPKRYC